MYTRSINDRVIFNAYHSFCASHCVCIAETDDEDESKDSSEYDSSADEWTAAGMSNGHGNALLGAESAEENQTHHQCSGTCTEVARSCSWAYTGECMCTASSTPDPWGLFSPHGCAAVVKSQLGGRGLIEISGNKSFSGANLSTAKYSNSVVQGSKGFYNASTGAQIACPCNTTCVSYGCCGSNGMTFEPHDTCLGRLDAA